MIGLKLSLTLFVAGIARTEYPHDALTFHDLAIFTTALYGSPDFHFETSFIF